MAVAAPLHVRAAAELELRRRERERGMIRRDDLDQFPLLDFVPAVSANYVKPDHLAPLAERLERFESHGEQRFVCHVPVRHGKTELLIHHIVRSLVRDPTRLIGYASYSADIAESKSRRACDIAKRAGVELVSDKAAEWRTAQGGGCIARGVGGGWAGRGVDELIVDDPIKDWMEARSLASRRHLREWFDTTAFNRVEPGGSIVVNMARWHVSDLSGSLIEQGWDYLRMPAIADSEDDPLGRAIGEPLWPDRWSLELIEERSRNPRIKAALYQGLPRPDGEALFQGVYYYDRLPTEGYRTVIGLDLAYTAKTSADHSAALALVSCGGYHYVAEVARRQVKAATFRVELADMQRRWRAPAYIYTGGGAENEAVDNLDRAGGLGINKTPATADKFVRAQPAATAWGEGRILVPRSAPWLADFLDEVGAFTGCGDPADDQIDALAAAYDAVANVVPLDYRSGQSRRFAGRGRGWA
jgi:predicted phage terminase large subunit-like protein